MTQEDIDDSVQSLVEAHIYKDLGMMDDYETELRGLIPTLEELERKGLATDKAIDEVAKRASASLTPISRMKAGFKSLGTGILNVGKSVAATAINTAALMGVGFLIDFAVQSIDGYINRVQYAQDAIQTIGDKWDESAKKQRDAKGVVDEYAEQYEELAKGVDTKTNENRTLNAEDYETYLGIVDRIATVMPNTIASYDAQGHAILNLTGNVRSLTSAYQDLERINRAEIQADAAEFLRQAQTGTFEESLGVFTAAQGSFVAQQRAEKLLEAIRANDTETVEQMLGADNYHGAGRYDPDYSDSAWKGEERFFQGILSQSGISFNGYDVSSVMNGQANLVSYIAQLQSTNASVLGQYRELAGSYVGDALATGGALAEITDSEQGLVANALNAFDLSFFSKLGSTPKAIQQGIYDNLIAPLTLKENRDALTALSEANRQFVDDEISGQMFQDIRNEAVRTLQNSAMPLSFDATKLLSTYYNDAMNPYNKGALDHAREVVTDSSDPGFEQWFYTRNATELAYLAGLSTQSDEAKTSMAGMSQQMVATAAQAAAQANTISALAEAYNSYTDARANAAEVANAVDNQGYMTPEQYDALDDKYKNAIKKDAMTGQTYVDYNELTRIDKEFAQGKIAELTQAKAEAQSQYNETLAEYMSLIDATSREEKQRRDDAKQDLLDLAGKIDQYDNLAQSYEGSTSAYKTWQNAMNLPEIGDEFRAAKQAVDAIDEGIKSGRTDTNQFQGSAQWLFGDRAGSMSLDEISSGAKQLKQMYDKSGNLKLGEFFDYANKQGVLQKGKGGTYYADGTIDIPTAAEMMGFSPEIVASMFQAANEYGDAHFETQGAGNTEETASLLAKTLGGLNSAADGATQRLSDLEIPEASGSSPDKTPEEKTTLPEAKGEKESPAPEVIVQQPDATLLEQPKPEAEPVADRVTLQKNAEALPVTNAGESSPAMYDQAQGSLMGLAAAADSAAQALQNMNAPMGREDLDSKLGENKKQPEVGSLEWLKANALGGTRASAGGTDVFNKSIQPELEEPEPVEVEVEQPDPVEVEVEANTESFDDATDEARSEAEQPVEVAM